ncbi:hypothetical protein LOTGIDRAFT_222755 [Lottia gigantea]|uniref:Protein AAR2 homolog n=1 Tax=Lottia gigantea TaxID=225164 RepID=V3YZ02_LOTGI|nr:hypothetical protein LOTGIDRAFT_222755 [Lottia gigantea]ESO83353.1 hypothetical protein LOTGIDRAFT_222755 [Lottia gigantea]
MDQEQAQVLFKEGAVFVFLDVPVGTEFGIDYNSWNVGPNFKGVKMIPPGIHFIYYSACNKEKDSAPRTGFFYNFKQREMVVRKWDKLTEDISPAPISDEEIERFIQNKQELDRYLGAYPYESYKKWVSLTNHITPQLVGQIQPENEKISAVTEFISESSTTQSRRDAMELSESKTDSEDSRLPKMETKPETVIRYSHIPKMKYPPGASPADITKYSMDSSYMLDSILSDRFSTNWNGILGELQFAFVCFMVGQNYDSFEQWKYLVHLLCSCEEAIQKYSNLYTQFISILHFQLQEIPEDFFVDIVSQNNFLTGTLQEFFSNLESSSADDKLKRRGSKFQAYLTKTFKWDFSTESDEYAPVVVSTD